MPGLLLDTHTLIWLAADLTISRTAELAVAKAQLRGELFVSPITAWETGVSSTKKNSQHRPPLSGQSPELWFRSSLLKFGIQLTPFDLEIASESAKVPALYGSGDPGDCFLLATAHVEGLSLITRDRRILKFANSNPAYLTAIAC